jgi:hypothetical protein
MTSSCCSCHHAARTLPRWPPGPSNEAYLSSPHLEASPATTFHACSSPAPTPVKPEPAPAILSQESVHTTLSITHHTRKQPSTGPRTTHGPHTSVVKLKWDMGILRTKVTHGLCDPKELRVTTSCGNVVCHDSGWSNTRLFARRPRH